MATSFFFATSFFWKAFFPWEGTYLQSSGKVKVLTRSASGNQQRHGPKFEVAHNYCEIGNGGSCNSNESKWNAIVNYAMPNWSPWPKISSKNPSKGTWTPCVADQWKVFPWRDFFITLFLKKYYSQNFIEKVTFKTSTKKLHPKIYKLLCLHADRVKISQQWRTHSSTSTSLEGSIALLNSN